MKRIVALSALVLVLLSSCARSVTPGEAASRHYKSCRAVR